jgi:hypothetical protein
LTTPTSRIISSANRTTDVLDGLGRKLTIRHLDALDRLRLLKAAGPDLSLNDSWLNMAALALSVVEINGIPRATPTNERQIESAVSELGDSGLQAVADVISQKDEATLLFDGLPEGNVAGTPI